VGGPPPAEVSLGPEDVRRLLIRQAFWFADLSLQRAGEGWDNEMWRLGPDYVVRLPRRAEGGRLILHEQAWLPKLAPRLPLPTPEPLFVGRPADGFPWSWHVARWIEGPTADIAPPSRGQGEALAAFLRALHQPCGDEAPANPVRGVPLSVRAPRMGALLEELAARSDVATARVRRAWAEGLAAPAADARVWLHGDLHARNVITRNGELAGVIDWGDLCGGDPATDLGAIWSLLPDQPERRAAIEAYGADDALLARARAWAVLFGATLYAAGLEGDARHGAAGQATLARIEADG
jgi:aminoglycoside phosphotransferase (APT) family kinase protein